MGSPAPFDISIPLKEKFGLSTFRKGQKDIIESVLKGHDALAVMPTGGGKSLCYQLPSVVKEGVVVVISPLIALMEDQTRNLEALGIPAGCLHSGQDRATQAKTFARMRESPHFLLYLSPERSQKDGFAQWVKTQKLSLIAIDESHCVSQWGPDFRKDYYRLSVLRELRPDVPILALTATATPEVLADIVKQLRLRKPDRHIHGFYRPNLYYQVESCGDEGEKLAYVRSALARFPTGRALIYCGTRKQTEWLAESLGDEFPGTGFYHAGLSTEDRARIQEDYNAGRLRILAATNAFGMGIDHPDVRLVVHFQMPANIESFYQEMGRAGRDGEPSTCLLLYSKRDKGLHAYFIQKSEADKASLDRRWRALDTIVQFAEGGECRHAGILTYFKDSFRMKACGHCDICQPETPRRVPSPWEGAHAFTPKTVVRKKKEKGSDGPLTEAEELRMEVLREWRKSYAEANDLPAFVIFSNKTLRDLAKRNPQDLDELEDCYGIGAHKREHLGALILAQLRSVDA